MFKIIICFYSLELTPRTPPKQDAKVIIKALVTLPMLKTTPVVEYVIKRIIKLVINPKIKPIKIPFFLIILVTIKVERNKLKAPKTVEIWVINVGEMLEYSTIILKSAKSSVKIIKAINIPKIVVLK